MSNSFETICNFRVGFPEQRGGSAQRAGGADGGGERGEGHLRAGDGSSPVAAADGVWQTGRDCCPYKGIGKTLKVTILTSADSDLYSLSGV